jgi:hypothetical protein
MLIQHEREHQQRVEERADEEERNRTLTPKSDEDSDASRY